jgi:hypothetical protein
MILGKDHPTFAGERARHLNYVKVGDITTGQYQQVNQLLASVEDGSFDGDYADLMIGYRKIIPYKPLPEIIDKQPDP